MVMEASGGLMTVASARRKPVHTVLSGPAGGVVASAHVAELAGAAHIITMDIGGTSTDISVIRNGVPAITREAKLENIPVRLPVIDIHAIGAGGGSIAWIDDGGALRVGPMSAEAVPGPACYRRGGTRPTTTDANVVLGRLGAETRLGGEMTLDVEAASTRPSRPQSPSRSASTRSAPPPASCASPTPTSCAVFAWCRSSAATTRAISRWCPSAAQVPCTARRWRGSSASRAW